MSEAVDKLIQGNQDSAEKHRIAYGEVMYNKGVEDSIKVVSKMFVHWPFNDDQDGEQMISRDDLLYKLSELTK